VVEFNVESAIIAESIEDEALEIEESEMEAGELDDSGVIDYEDGISVSHDYIKKSDSDNENQEQPNHQVLLDDEGDDSFVPDYRSIFTTLFISQAEFQKFQAKIAERLIDVSFEDAERLFDENKEMLAEQLKAQSKSNAMGWMKHLGWFGVVLQAVSSATLIMTGVGAPAAAALIAMTGLTAGMQVDSSFELGGMEKTIGAITQSLIEDQGMDPKHAGIVASVVAMSVMFILTAGSGKVVASGISKAATKMANAGSNSSKTIFGMNQAQAFNKLQTGYMGLQSADQLVDMVAGITMSVFSYKLAEATSDLEKSDAETEVAKTFLEHYQNIGVEISKQNEKMVQLAQTIINSKETDIQFFNNAFKI